MSDGLRTKLRAELSRLPRTGAEVVAGLLLGVAAVALRWWVF